MTYFGEITSFWEVDGTGVEGWQLERVDPAVGVGSGGFLGAVLHVSSSCWGSDVTGRCWSGACVVWINWKAAQSITEGLGIGDPQGLGVSRAAFFARKVFTGRVLVYNPRLAGLSSWSLAYNIVSGNLGMRQGGKPTFKIWTIQGNFLGCPAPCLLNVSSWFLCPYVLTVLCCQTGSFRNEKTQIKRLGRIK